MHAGTRLLRRDGDAHQRCVVQALQPHQVAPMVGDGDDDVPSIANGLGLGGSGDRAGVVESEDLARLHRADSGQLGFRARGSHENR